MKPVFPKPGLQRSGNPTEEAKALYGLLPELSDEGLMAIYLRFWEKMTIQEISNFLGLSWDEADHLIEESIQKMRAGFLERNLSNAA